VPEDELRMPTVGLVGSCALVGRKYRCHPNTHGSSGIVILSGWSYLANATGQIHSAELLVMMPAGAMHMAVLQLFRRRFAHAHDLHVKMQGLVSERMIAVERHHVAHHAGHRE